MKPNFKMRSTFSAAILAVYASAHKIPLVHNPHSLSDLMTMKDDYLKLVKNSDQGEHVDIQNFMDSQYMIKIKLGSNDQEFLVAPDTASSNLWIYSKQCQAFECSTHNKYDSSKSESYEKDGRDFKLRTANGKVEGFVSKDMCKLTDDITAKMSFGEIVSVKSKTPVISKMDGTIGLGFDIASVDHLPTFMS